MPVLRSPRREMFAQAVAKSPKTRASLAQCYEASGYKTTGHGSEAAASRLLSTVEIRTRIDEILRPVTARTRVSIESLLNELETTITDARADGQHGVVIGALTLSAKLVGLLRDKIEVGRVGDFDACESNDEIAAKMLD